MTLNKACNLFESLISESDKKSAKKVYQEFIQILSSLESKDLSKIETQSIEQKLDALDLNSNSKKSRRYFSKALNQFKEYLKAEFSLITKGHYTALGMALGMCFGVAAGSLIDRGMGTSSGLAIGMAIGVAIGRYMDNEASKQGKVI
ncbi:MAG: galactokinase [Arcticibacterium sp.]|jgi:galactokinase